MEIPRQQRLSFKQAGVTVLVAFLLGVLLSVIQVGIDYASEDAAINHEIDTLLKITHTPAARIAYNIDDELAQELVLGLIRSPAVLKAEMLDHNGIPLASTAREPISSQYRFISDSLFGARRVFSEALRVDHAPDEHLGTLSVEVDTYAFGSHFLKRALLTLANGFVRTLFLSLILLVLFYFMLTKPLVTLTRELDSRNPRSGSTPPLPCPTGHERDEIGVLVDAINRQQRSIADEMAQRRAAEDRITQHLAELESIVSARTKELEQANWRLSESNRNLEAARRTAEDMAQQRAAFLAHMSHEIRTPLNGLLGMIALSLDAPLDAQQRQQLEIANESGKTLVNLLNDFLDLSKFEARQYELEHIPFDLGALIEETASLLSQNTAAGVELTCHISPQLPAKVLGDPTRIRQIVSNLLFNALKFTRAGRVDVYAKPQAGGVYLSVYDTGIGIEQSVLPDLFQPFRQASTGTTRQFGGTGLGLALTRTLCDAMNGELTVSSELGEGSQFSVWLPLEAHEPPRAMAGLDGQAVLIGQLGSGLDEMLSAWIPNWNMTYVCGSGLEWAQGLRPDVFIVNDIKTARALRQSTSTPIILIATYGLFLRPEHASEMGHFQQLPRPVTRAALHEGIGHALSGTFAPPKRMAHATAVTAHSKCILLVEDNTVNQLVAKAMLTRLGYQVALAGNGREAIAYLEKHDVDLILMDCNMPVMDGYEATRHIRAQERWQALPIIALTANAMPNERQSCEDVGMNDYLAKPFNRDDLRERIETWLPEPDTVSEIS
ncbi:hybrid sensor histidine kinase/response regulator [Pseudomonas matsuisoli]|uniref:histidine kinase n=1 Tax=Pseudomonas matsuisoli TaxID=1515666 RepID=A0A917UR20_9PSED|nr:response regulator [Pseudomonas matsuisoli]GGJ79054.1 hybrid sensor histidine kinase/response regulator [Pseudomonas matsuisoli]